MRVLIKITYSYIHTTINSDKARGPSVRAPHVVRGPVLDHACVGDEVKWLCYRQLIVSKRATL